MPDVNVLWKFDDRHTYVGLYICDDCGMCGWDVLSKKIQKIGIYYIQFFV